jgi:hypothetical protein
MPTKVYLYTLGEIKELLAKIHNEKPGAVTNFENRTIMIGCDCGDYEATDEHFLLMVKENG